MEVSNVKKGHCATEMKNDFFFFWNSLDSRSWMMKLRNDFWNMHFNPLKGLGILVIPLWFLFPIPEMQRRIFRGKLASTIHERKKNLVWHSHSFLFPCIAVKEKIIINTYPYLIFLFYIYCLQFLILIAYFAWVRLHSSNFY